MKCSNCSSVVRPVIVLDIDGTLADYHRHFIYFAEQWLGRPWQGGAYRGAEPFHEWFTRSFGCDRTTFRNIKLAYRQGGMKRLMGAFTDAKALALASKLQGELWLTTNRPHDRFDRVDPDTREWLRRWDIPFDGLLYSDNKMEALAERVDPERVCFVLDDLIPNLEAADRAFPKAGIILRRNEFNPDVLWPLAVGSLLDARALMTAHVQDWAASHAFDDLPTTN